MCNVKDARNVTQKDSPQEIRDTRPHTTVVQVRRAGVKMLVERIQKRTPRSS